MTSANEIDNPKVQDQHTSKRSEKIKHYFTHLIKQTLVMLKIECYNICKFPKI